MIRQAVYNDIYRILLLKDEAKERLKENNIPQWQGDYPGKDDFLNDIKNKDLYVYERDGLILGFMALQTRPEKSYDTLVGGEWEGESYLTVHRIVVGKSFLNQGLAKEMLEFAYEKTCERAYDSLRIDTRPENKAIIHLAGKMSFAHKGTVDLGVEGKRLAYEKTTDRDFGVYIKKFEDLTPEEIYEILYIRQEVFQFEQDSLYRDLDNLDQKSYHVLAKQGGNVRGCIRVIPRGLKFDEASLGRFALVQGARKTGMGKILLQRTIDFILEDLSEDKIKIEAQYGLEDYYGAFGFETQSEIYLIDGIDHVEMVKFK